MATSGGRRGRGHDRRSRSRATLPRRGDRSRQGYLPQTPRLADEPGGEPLEHRDARVGAPASPDRPDIAEPCRHAREHARERAADEPGEDDGRRFEAEDHPRPEHDGEEPVGSADRREDDERPHRERRWRALSSEPCDRHCGRERRKADGDPGAGARVDGRGCARRVTVLHRPQERSHLEHSVQRGQTGKYPLEGESPALTTRLRLSSCGGRQRRRGPALPDLGSRLASGPIYQAESVEHDPP